MFALPFGFVGSLVDFLIDFADRGGFTSVCRVGGVIAMYFVGFELFFLLPVAILRVG